MRDGQRLDVEKIIDVEELEDRLFVAVEQRKLFAVVEGEQPTAAALGLFGSPQPVHIYNVTTAEGGPAAALGKDGLKLLHAFDGLGFAVGKDGVGFAGLGADRENLGGIDVFNVIAQTKGDVEAGAKPARKVTRNDSHSSSKARSCLRLPADTDATPLTLSPKVTS